MKKAVGWIRKGSKPDEMAQREAIVAYCNKENLEITEWKKGEDFGAVAYGNWMGHRKIDAVVAATNLDVTDSVFEFYAYGCKLGMRNSSLIVVDWQDYPGYAMHRSVMERLVNTICRNELEHEPVRISTGRIRKATAGGYIGGNAPMGYKVVDGRLVVDREEAKVVKFIMVEKHAGRTKLGTVEKLNAAGYKTRRGGRFQISTVQSIWNNEQFYRGYYLVKDTGEWVKGQHEAILKD